MHGFAVIGTREREIHKFIAFFNNLCYNKLKGSDNMAKNYLLAYSEQLSAIDELTFKNYRNLCGRIRRMLIASCKTLKSK